MGIGVYNVTLNMGEVSVTSATASFIIGQVPVFSTILAVILYREKISRLGVLGLVVSFTGICVIAVHMSGAVMYLYAMPLLVLLMAWRWLGSWSDLTSLLGGLLALAGVMIVNFKRTV